VAGASFAFAPALADRLPGAAVAAVEGVSIVLGAGVWFALWRIPPRPAMAPGARVVAD